MKKSIIALAVLLVAVSGCATTDTNVNNDKTLLTIDGDSISAKDVYKGLKASGDVSAVTAAIDKVVANTAVKTTKEIEKEAKAALQTYKNSVESDKWEATLKDKGYKNEKQYYEDVSLVTVKLSKVTEAYIKKEFSELASRYEVKKLRIFTTNDSQKAKQAAEALEKKKADFEAITKQFGDTSKYNGSEGVYNNTSGLPSTVWNAVLDMKKGEISKTIADPDNGAFYIVQLSENDATKFKEDATTSIKSISIKNENGLSLDDEAYHYFLLESGYNVHDTDVYAALLAKSGKYSRD